jgi:predicted dinucleotide-binding enzyme
MPQPIGILGSGEVGEALADGFLKHGYAVMRGSRDPGKLADWHKKAGAKASVGTFGETARFGQILVLAVKGSGAESALKSCAPADLRGKTILDTTNPISDAAPVNGVLKYDIGINDSLMERVQRAVPDANLVKAFSIVGSSLMVDPVLKGGPPTMFICGNSAAAKAEASEILIKFGWEVDDMGGVEAARAIEPLAILWCIPGFLRNEWKHAFKMLRA